MRQEYSLELDTSTKEYSILQSDHEATNVDLRNTRSQLEELRVIATRVNEELSATLAELKAESTEREQCQAMVCAFPIFIFFFHLLFLLLSSFSSFVLLYSSTFSFSCFSFPLDIAG